MCLIINAERFFPGTKNAHATCANWDEILEFWPDELNILAAVGDV